MVKREPVPIGPDNAHYFAAYNVYPLNFDWEIEGNVIKHVRWVAACLGTPAPFWAFHYKKTVSAIVLEVEKARGTDSELTMRKMLGEHRWKDILLNPSKDERDHATQIFLCRHQNAIEMAKDGWRRVAIQAEWFHDWSPDKCFKVDPYPTPVYCIPPHTDKTNVPFAKPIPPRIIPKPLDIVRVKPVPGSNVWTDSKAGSMRLTNQFQGSLKKGRKEKTVTQPRSGWDKPIFQGSSSNIPAASKWPSSAPSASIMQSSDPRETCSTNTDTLSVKNYGPPPGLFRSTQPMETVELTDSDEEFQDVIIGNIELSASFAAAEPKSHSTVSKEQPNHSDEAHVWGGYLTKPKESESEPDPICPVHDRVCKRAICSAYDKLIRKRHAELRKEGKPIPVKVGPYNAKRAEMEEQAKKDADKAKKNEENKEKQREMTMNRKEEGRAAKRNARGRSGASRSPSPFDAWGRSKDVNREEADDAATEASMQRSPEQSDGENTEEEPW